MIFVRVSTSRSLGEFHIIGPEDRGPGDLKLLRNLLDRWGCAEEAKIRETHAGDDRENLSARRAAQSDRLEREIEILRAIDTARTDVSRRRSERTRAIFLDELSKPVNIGGNSNRFLCYIFFFLSFCNHTSHEFLNAYIVAV